MNAATHRYKRAWTGAASGAIAAGVLIASGVAASAQDARNAPGFAAPVSANMNGLVALRDRTQLAVYPGPVARGAVPVAQAEDEASSPWPNSVRGAVGCTISGTIATVAAFAAGGENLLNFVAGGLVPSVNQAALYVGLVGVVFGSFCALGQSLTPIFVHNVLDLPERAPRPPAVDVRHASAAPRVAPVVPQRLAFQAGVLGGALADATRRLSPGDPGPPARTIPGDAPPVLVARQP